MNMSRVITSLKTLMQIHQIGLPFKDENGNPVPDENVIWEVLKNATIPVFSQYVPWRRSTVYDVRNLECIDRRSALYRLPKELYVTELIYIINISMPNKNGRATLGDYTPAYGINRSVQGVITANAYQMVAGEMRHEPTWEYAGANKVHLYGWPRIPLQFEMGCEHLPNGETIPAGCYKSFMDLAKLDLSMFLYNALKHYKGLPTAHGTNQLNIDELQGAEAARDALLEKWDDTYHLDMGWETWM